MNLEDRLERLANRTPPGDPADVLAAARARADSSRRSSAAPQRFLASAAAVVAVLAVAGAALAVGIGDGDDASEVATGTVSPFDEPGWHPLPDAPIGLRSDVASVATDEELFVWGGRGEETHPHYADGATYSFDDNAWRTVPEAPLTGRADAVAAWTGERVLVWGGAEREGGEPLFDGAAWNPDTGDWEQYDEFVGAVHGETAVAAVGGEVFFVGVGVPPNMRLSSDTFAFDPQTGDWRTLDPYPYDEYGAVTSRKAFATDHGVLVVTVGADGVAVAQLNPSTGEWGPADTAQMPTDNVDARTAAWTGEAVVLANASQPGYVLWPANWSGGDIVPPSETGRDLPAVALDNGIVSVGDRWLDTTDLGSGEAVWRDSGPVPGEADDPAAAAHDGRLYVWGDWRCPAGNQCSDSQPGTAAVWTPPTRDSTRLDTGGPQVHEGGGLDGPVIYAPRRDGAGSEYALLAGTLTRAGDCLYLARGGAGRYVIVWPHGTTWDAGRGSVVLPDGGFLAVGEKFSASGGYHGFSEFPRLPADAARRAESCADPNTDSAAVIQSRGVSIGGHAVNAPDAPLGVSAPTYDLTLPGAELVKDTPHTAGTTDAVLWTDGDGTYLSLAVRPGEPGTYGTPSGAGTMTKDDTFPADQGQAWLSEPDDPRAATAWVVRPSGDLWMLRAHWYGETVPDDPQAALRRWAVGIEHQPDASPPYVLDDSALAPAAFDAAGSPNARSRVWEYQGHEVTLIVIEGSSAAEQGNMLARGAPTVTVAPGLGEVWSVDSTYGWALSRPKGAWATLTVPEALAAEADDILAALTVAPE